MNGAQLDATKTMGRAGDSHLIPQPYSPVLLSSSNVLRTPWPTKPSKRMCANIFCISYDILLHMYFKETKMFKTGPHKEIRLRGERAGILFQAHAGLLVL